MAAPTTRFAPSGFTLIEIVVTIGIMAVIMTLTLVNFSTITSVSGSKLSNETLVSDLRSMAQKSLMKEYYQGRMTFGWGAYFDFQANEYILFADLDNNKMYDSGERLRTVSLENKAQLDKAIFDNLDYTENASVVFSSETALANFNGNWVTPALGNIVIDVSDERQQNTKHVIIFPLGVVDIQ